MSPVGGEAVATQVIIGAIRRAAVVVIVGVVVSFGASWWRDRRKRREQREQREEDPGEPTKPEPDDGDE